MTENEKKLLRRMVLGSALNSIQESSSAMVNLKDSLPSGVGITDIMREIRGIESYVANYEKYKPYLPIIEDYIQKHDGRDEQER